jgi:hypothetical protein
MNLLVDSLKWFALCWVVISLIQHGATTLAIKYKWARLLEYPCYKCYTFWATLAITWNPFVAAIAAYIAHVTDNSVRFRL